jgi:hypothetical protein
MVCGAEPTALNTHSDATMTQSGEVMSSENIEWSARNPVISWLMDPVEPSMTYLVSRDLLKSRPSARNLERLRALVLTKGWAARIVARQRERTWWATKETCYRPKFHSTIWQLQVLADLGLTKGNERIANAVEFWFGLHYAKDGGYSPTVRGSRGHLCTTGNMVRSLIRMGYLRDERVQSAIQWLVSQQLRDGGWDCFGRPNGTLDAWEAMSAFTEIPEHRRTSEIRESIRRGAAFFLKRRLLYEGPPAREWLKFHYPWHYFYDVLVGLDFVVRLGYSRDSRLRQALSLLASKRRTDGKWVLDGVHGIGGTDKRFSQVMPMIIESPHRPSKMVTFLAMRVLKGVERD